MKESKNNLFRKGMIFGIICLFMGASILPVICSYLGKGDDMDL